MAITVDWISGKISIPKADTAYVGLNPWSQEVRSLDVNELRLTLRDLEDDADGGRPWPKTHNHETESTLAGIIFIRKIIFLAPYYFEFEAGDYRVNLSAENSNFVDRLYHNGVTVVPQNSAGGQVTETGVSGLTPTESQQITDTEQRVGELHKLQGLDAANPLTVTPTTRDAGSISQSITGDGETETTVTRN